MGLWTGAVVFSDKVPFGHMMDWGAHVCGRLVVFGVPFQRGPWAYCSG